MAETLPLAGYSGVRADLPGWDAARGDPRRDARPPAGAVLRCPQAGVPGRALSRASHARGGGEPLATLRVRRRAHRRRVPRRHPALGRGAGREADREADRRDSSASASASSGPCSEDAKAPLRPPPRGWRALRPASRRRRAGMPTGPRSPRDPAARRPRRWGSDGAQGALGTNRATAARPRSSGRDRARPPRSAPGDTRRSARRTRPTPSRARSGAPGGVARAVPNVRCQYTISSARAPRAHQAGLARIGGEPGLLQVRPREDRASRAAPRRRDPRGPAGAGG